MQRRNESRAEGGMDIALPLHYSSTGASRSIHSADKRSVARSPNDDDAYDSDYDFGLSPINVRNSQSLFAARLHAASPTSPIRQQQTHHQYTLPPPPSPYDLDRNLYCTPREFEAEWQSLSGRTYEYPIIISSSLNIPSLTQCSIHFNQIGWSIIASGVINDNTITRLFLIAQRRVGKMMSVEESGRRRSGSNGKKNPTHPRSSMKKTIISRYLAQLSIDAMNSLVTLEMRSRNDDEDQIKFFVRSLELDQLLGVMVR